MLQETYNPLIERLAEYDLGALYDRFGANKGSCDRGKSFAFELPVGQVLGRVNV